MGKKIVDDTLDVYVLVLLKLFINGNERCITNDTPSA